jgi:glutaredoxin
LTRRVVLYSKADCCLCHGALEILQRLSGEFDLEIEEVDIAQDPALYDRYRYTIPVVVIDGKQRLESKIAEHYLRRALSEGMAEGRRWPWQR